MNDLIIHSFFAELEKIAGSRLRKAVKVVVTPGSDSKLTLHGKIIGNLHLSKDNQILGSGINDRFKGMGLYSKLLGETLKKTKKLKSGPQVSGPATAAWLRFAKKAPVETHPTATIHRWSPKSAQHPHWGNVMRGQGRKVGDVKSSVSDDKAHVFSAKKPSTWTK